MLERETCFRPRRCPSWRRTWPKRSRRLSTSSSGRPGIVWSGDALALMSPMRLGMGNNHEGAGGIFMIEIVTLATKYASTHKFLRKGHGAL